MNRLGRGIIVVAMGLGMMPVGFAALDPAAAVNRALEAYDGGNFDQAAAFYEEALSAGVANGHLYYNLGHAYYKQGKTGKAMAAFLAARRYLPRNPDVQANLTFLKGKITDRLPIVQPPSVVGTLLFWAKWFTPLELWRAAMLVLALLCFGLGFVLIKQRLGRLRNALLAGFALPVFLAGSGILASVLAEHWGAITSDATTVRSGPNEQNPVLFELNEGAPFMVEDQTGEWLQIRLADGKKGWVPSSRAQVF